MGKYVLFHYTRVDSVIDIIKGNELKTNFGYISFTRDKFFHRRDIFYKQGVLERENRALLKWKYPIFCRLVLNKSLLRNNYRTIHVNVFGKNINTEGLNSTRPIGEEGCFRNITNLDKYYIILNYFN